MAHYSALATIGVLIALLNIGSAFWMAWFHYTTPGYRVRNSSAPGRLYLGSWAGLFLVIVIAAFTA